MTPEERARDILETFVEAQGLAREKPIKQTWKAWAPPRDKLPDAELTRRRRARRTEVRRRATARLKAIRESRKAAA